MNKKTTFAGLGLLVVTVGGLGVGSAYASTNAPVTATISHSALTAQAPGATDGDNVQQGDQTGPDTADTPTAGDTPDSTARAAADVPTAGDTPDSTARAAADVPTAGDKADSVTSPEKADTEAADSETPDSSDGPGGHADTNSNADTQQEGQH